MELRYLAGTALLTVSLSAVQPLQAAGALPDNVLELRQMAREARDAGADGAYRDASRKLHQLRPFNHEYMHQLVLAYARLGDLSAAFDLMLKMQRQGISYDFNESPDSEALRNFNLYPYLNDLMVQASQPMGQATEFSRLDADVGLVEAIAWDDRRQAFLVGSVTDGRLIQVKADGGFEELLRANQDNGLWGIQDLVVDSGRNRLWVTSAATPEFSGFDPADSGRSALFEFDLGTLELLGRHPVPVDGLPHRLGQMTLGPKGALFIADRTLPIIYAFDPDSNRMAGVFASRELVSLRGIAASDSRPVIYFADYELGIVRLDLESSQYSYLARPETLNLGGIEGLEFVDGDLVVIQGGFRPQRVMRLILDPTGTAITDVAPVAVAMDTFDHPGFGALHGDELVYVASTRSNISGATVKNGPVLLLRSGVEGLRAIVPPDMQRYMDSQSRQRMQRPGLEDQPKAEKEEPGEGG